MIDYRDLLKRYIAGVGDIEGVYYDGECECSSEERAELNRIIEELSQEYRDGRRT